MGAACSRGGGGGEAQAPALASAAVVAPPRAWSHHAAAQPRAASAGAATLLELCMRTVAEGAPLPSLLSQVGDLPPELAQALLRECVASRRLTAEVLRAFSCCNLWDVSLAHLPGVDDSWVELLVAHAASLQRLSLEECLGVSDAGVRALAACNQLQSLSLAGCAGVTDDGLACAPALTQLAELSCRGCVQLTARALAHVASLTRLRTLDLSMCRGVAALDSLRALSLLQVLRLGWTGVTDTDMQHVAAVGASLVELQLCRTRVSDAGLAALAHKLPRLRKLDATGCRLSDVSGAALGSFTSLTELALDSCAIGNAGLAELARGVTLLTALNLAHTHVTDDGLRACVASLPLLADLDLECCAVTDAGVAALAGCAELRRLVLCDTATTNAGVRSLRELPLHTLGLSFTGVTDAGLDALPASLVDVRLDTRGVSDAGLRTVARLTRLRRLDLFGARITDAGLRHLVGLQASLRELDVCSGGVTDVGVETLSHFHHLEKLNLSQNWRITDASVPALCGLTSLRSLSLCGTGLSGAGVLQFAHAPPQLRALAVYGCGQVALEAESVQAQRPALRVTCAGCD